MSVLLILFILVLAEFSDAEPPNDLKAYSKETRSHGRRFIVEDLARHWHKQQELLDSIPCIKSFLTKYIKVPASTLVLVLDADDDLQVFARSLLTSLDVKFAFFQHSDSHFGSLDRAFDAIVLMPNVSSIVGDFKAPKPCKRDCFFVCILTAIFQDTETFLDQVDTLIQSMWTQRIAKVIVLAKVGDSVLAAGSRTFRPQQLCVPSAALVFDECENNSWNKLQELHAPELNDCILKVAYFEGSPHVITTNNSEELYGFEGRLIEEVLKELPIDREKVEWDDNSTYTEQADILLYEGAMADVVIGGLLQRPNNDIGYSCPYDILKVVWLIPRSPSISLKGLITPFDPYVWAAIGGSLLLGGVIKTFLSRDLSWLDIFALIIGTSLPRQPTKLSSRILFLSWSIYGLFLTQLYVDSLADQLINQSDFKIETMEELINSSFKIGGVAAYADFFSYDEADETTRQIREKFVMFDKGAYIKLFEDVISGENDTYALITVMNSSRSKPVESFYAYSLTADPVCSFPLVFAAWQGFPCLEIIDTTLKRLNDVGITNFVTEMAIRYDVHDTVTVPGDERTDTSLHFPQLIPAFLVLFCGFVGGFILLLIEIILYPSKYLE